MRSAPAQGWMRPSAQVDLAQLRRSLRPVVRSELEPGADRLKVRQWARRQGLYLSLDRDGFFALSPIAVAARRVLRIDARPGRHAIALGRALGYPACCSREAARRGEENIDAWSGAMSRRRFFGRFRAIGPGDYAAGGGYISHVPCSHRCAASLRLVLALVAADPQESRRSSFAGRRRAHASGRRCG